MRQVDACTVAQYRFLYNTVGAPYVWWLRRTMPDADLAALLAQSSNQHPCAGTGEGEIAGFYELDRTNWPNVNLELFRPDAAGPSASGLGYAFLRHAGGRRLGRRARAA